MHAADRDAHLAEDVTQAVFLLLSHKAARMKPGTSIAGWLFRTARLTSANAMKMERRRVRRETTAALAAADRDSSSRAAAGSKNESDLLAALDRAMVRLRAPDRDVLVLRFYDNKSVSEAATELGVSLEAAKKRFARSLDALRQALADQGVAVPAGGAAMAILAAAAPQSAHAVPAGLSAWVAGGASPTAISARAVAIVRWMRLRKLLAATLAASLLLMLGVGTAAVASTWTSNQSRRHPSRAPPRRRRLSSLPRRRPL
jgi:RNA polymerase sigma factor (sigma-70 family)